MAFSLPYVGLVESSAALRRFVNGVKLIRRYQVLRHQVRIIQLHVLVRYRPLDWAILAELSGLLWSPVEAPRGWWVTVSPKPVLDRDCCQNASCVRCEWAVQDGAARTWIFIGQRTLLAVVGSVR